jgi:cholesterol transport system auxiliary component
MVEQRLRMRLGLERPVLSGKDNVRPLLADKRSIAQLRVTVDEFTRSSTTPATAVRCCA